MLRIKKIKIDINTDDGLYGAEHEFSTKLNIVRGNNTSGKSSLLQSIYYGMGLEELIGGKGEKTMQSVMKDFVLDAANKRRRVISSVIYLELENSQQEIITTKRFIKSENRDSRYIDVYFGQYLSTGKYSKHQEMYLHDPNAAKDLQFGFHAFLEKFLGWELPLLTNSKGSKIKLYLQCIFPAFFIEQKVGWSDFLATIPQYGIRSSTSKAIEFILNLDILISGLKRQDIKEQKQLIKNEWQVLYSKLEGIAKDGGGQLFGLTELPEVINSFNQIDLSFTYNDEKIILSDYITKLREDLSAIEQRLVPKISDNIEIYENQLGHLKKLLSNTDFQANQLIHQQIFEKEKLLSLKEQFNNVLDELRKNKAERKLKKYGAESSMSIAKDNCPTCNQLIKDMLLPQDIFQNPMDIEENIKYLEAQKSMLQFYLNNQESLVTANDKLQSKYEEKSYDLRKELRALKRTLISDDRLPSEKEIENKVKIQNRLNLYQRLQNKFIEEIGELENLNKRLKSILKEEAKLPPRNFNKNDFKIFKDFKTYFKELLKSFNYKSKNIELVDVSSAWTDSDFLIVTN